MKINFDIEASKSNSSEKRIVQYRVHNKAAVHVVEEEVAVVIATEVVVQIQGDPRQNDPQHGQGNNAPIQCEPGPGDPGPEQDTLEWCKCGLCRPMPTQIENKCCCTRRMECITVQPLFHQLVLDGNVLDIAMGYRGRCSCPG